MSEHYTRQTAAVKQALAAAGLDQELVPEPAALEVHNRLLQAVAERIRQAGGIISFAEFMHAVLYMPGHGYYVSGARKFGEGGDFVTAPEISPLFGQCIANQAIQVLQALDEPAQAQHEEPLILEFGPGTGALCVAVLKHLEQHDRLPASYLLMEVSPELQQRQQQRIAREIPHLQSKVRWLTRLPERFDGMVIANEVLDAMAVERFRIDAGQVQQLCVKTAASESGRPDTIQFDWSRRPAPAELEEQVRKLEARLQTRFAHGYTSEINFWVGPWIEDLAQRLGRGLLLIIDYGYAAQEYYHPQRSTGTLKCHYRHRAHQDPFLLAGLQDITSDVDFTRVASAAVDAGLSVAGFTPQAQFLLGCGLEALIDPGLLNDPVAFAKLSQQVKWLTLPGEMGERFKVLALSKAMTQDLVGFSVLNLVHRL